MIVVNSYTNSRASCASAAVKGLNTFSKCQNSIFFARCYVWRSEIIRNLQQMLVIIVKCPCAVLWCEKSVKNRGIMRLGEFGHFLLHKLHSGKCIFVFLLRIFVWVVYTAFSIMHANHAEKRTSKQQQLGHKSLKP